ncbi:branched-chain amino acid transport system II carrier protein [Priestia abyssalis]|uniref:branched-chain amino acid transport system II carrier protein n=1 Tax=Priestia abyssalis TaxID=1221450 RepID=UPI0009953C1A|nr:branched-chain amino acid transport system II carrier protein [Priestia abyssalis]
MTSLSRKDTMFVGLMLFALFFGAGNLIFPPFLGQEAGKNFWPAIFGFIITGVGLPFLTVIAIALAKDGVKTLGNRVHPVFGLIFATAVYLSIGPFMGIPRGANVAFEMGIKPFLSGERSGIALLIFTILFFALVYWVSLNPSKLVDRIGSLLTPVLLAAIAFIGAGSLMKYNGPLGDTTAKYVASPVFSGFMEGYLTMDTIAALAFGIVVVTSIQSKGVTEQSLVVKAVVKAGLVAGIGLAAVYVVVGLLGAKMNGTFDNGGAILTTAAKALYGQFGVMLLGLIVMLACFTTCVGLIVATSQYFEKLVPAVSYKTLVTVITAVSFLIANLGLNQIIALSVPVLIIIYPITIVLVGMSFFHKAFGGSRLVYAGALLGAGIVSLFDGLKMFGMAAEMAISLFEKIPLYGVGLGWFIPALAGGIVGYTGEWILKHVFGKKVTN